MIEVKNISKAFVKKINKKEKKEFKADNDISLEVNDGEVVGLLGPNGAGKTTLLRILAGIMTPDSGEIIIDGLNYRENAERIKKQIAFLSGNTKLYKDLSAYELLKMCAAYYEIEESKQEERIKTVTEEFNIEEFLHQRLSSLSTGQMQRVNIARCALHDPKYYIFDEATSGLDIISSKIILDFINEEKKKGKCIIYSTHYMEEAENICDRVVLVHKGNVKAAGTPEEILKKTKTSNLRDAFFALIGDADNE